MWHRAALPAIARLSCKTFVSRQQPTSGGHFEGSPLDYIRVYGCLNGTAPAFLSADLLCVSEVGPRRRLHSATTSALGRRTQRSTIGDRAFAAAAPAVWNSLPKDVRSSTSLQLFRRRLKSELFRRSLGPRHST